MELNVGSFLRKSWLLGIGSLSLSGLLSSHAFGLAIRGVNDTTTTTTTTTTATTIAAAQNIPAAALNSTETPPLLAPHAEASYYYPNSVPFYCSSYSAIGSRDASDYLVTFQGSLYCSDSSNYNPFTCNAGAARPYYSSYYATYPLDVQPSVCDNYATISSGTCYETILGDVSCSGLRISYAGVQYWSSSYTCTRAYYGYGNVVWNCPSTTWSVYNNTGSSCFPKDTKVTVKVGTEGPKEVTMEDLRAGNYVNKNTLVLAGYNDNNEPNWQKLLDIPHFKTEGTYKYLVFATANTETTLSVSEEHLIQVWDTQAKAKKYMLAKDVAENFRKNPREAKYQLLSKGKPVAVLSVEDKGGEGYYSPLVQGSEFIADGYDVTSFGGNPPALLMSLYPMYQQHIKGVPSDFSNLAERGLSQQEKLVAKLVTVSAMMPRFLVFLTHNLWITDVQEQQKQGL